MRRPRRNNPSWPFPKKPRREIELKVYISSSGAILGRITVPAPPKLFAVMEEITPEWLMWESEVARALTIEGFGRFVKPEEDVSKGLHPASPTDLQERPGRGWTWYRVDPTGTIEEPVLDLRVVEYEENPSWPFPKKAKRIWWVGDLDARGKVIDEAEILASYNIPTIDEVASELRRLGLVGWTSKKDRGDVFIEHYGGDVFHVSGHDGVRMFRLEPMDTHLERKGRSKNPSWPFPRRKKQTVSGSSRLFEIYGVDDPARLLGQVWAEPPPDENNRALWRAWELEFRNLMLGIKYFYDLGINPVHFRMKVRSPGRLAIFNANLEEFHALWDAALYKKNPSWPFPKKKEEGAPCAYTDRVWDEDERNQHASLAKREYLEAHGIRCSHGWNEELSWYICVHEDDYNRASWLAQTADFKDKISRYSNPSWPFPRKKREKSGYDPREALAWDWDRGQLKDRVPGARYTGKVVAVKDSYAPCCIIVAKVFRARSGELVYSTRDEDNNQLHDHDEVEDIATHQGWDGMGDPWDWFADHAEIPFDDPGYF